MALGFVRSAAILIIPFWRLSNGLRRGRTEAQYCNREEDGANHADKMNCAQTTSIPAPR